jgi:hypothetical protein
MTEDGRVKPSQEGVKERRLPEFLLDVESQDALNRFGPLGQWFAANAAYYLMESSQRRLIDLVDAKRIIQFGASRGEETITLAELARLNGGTVTALEIDEERGKNLKRSRIISAERVAVGDGIDYLKKMAERGETCDLITAFFLDWTYPEELSRKLIPAAQAVLPFGKLLVTSDRDPMMAIRGVLNELGIKYDNLYAGIDLDATSEDMLTRNKAGGAFRQPQRVIYASPNLPGTEIKDTIPFFKHSGIVTSFQKKSK